MFVESSKALKLLFKHVSNKPAVGYDLKSKKQIKKYVKIACHHCGNFGHSVLDTKLMLTILQ